MPTPRQAAQKTGANLPGAPKGYCGACGLPSKDCACSSYKEWGSQAGGGGAQKKPNAGSESPTPKEK